MTPQFMATLNGSVPSWLPKKKPRLVSQFSRAYYDEADAKSKLNANIKKAVEQRSRDTLDAYRKAMKGKGPMSPDEVSAILGISPLSVSKYCLRHPELVRKNKRRLEWVEICTE